MYPPTVFTRTSIRFSRGRISFVPLSIPPGCMTSALRSVTFVARAPRTFSKYGISRSKRYTETAVAPVSGKALHPEEPRYPVPPVTTTTFPSNPSPASGRPSRFMSLAASDQTGKSEGGDCRGVSDEVREAFVARVKAIDPVFKRGDLDQFWPMLRELMGMASIRRDLSQKKSHYLASLAVRSLGRDDPRSALAFLDFADRSIDRSHLTPFLLGERADFRRPGAVLLKCRRPR